MKKGNSATLILLIVEIAAITVLHAVKINQTGKSANKGNTKSIYSSQPDSKIRTAYSLAVYK